LYIYSTDITSGQLEWLNILDFTRVNSSYKFEQDTENIEWTITHNLNTQDLFVIVYDSDGNKQVESEIQFQSDNEIKLIFSEPISGKALLFGASVISSPSNMYTKEEIDELLKNVSGGSGNIVLPENGQDGQVLIKDSSTESGLNWSDKIDGKSAYEIAKDHNFEGTEEEWLKSLKGTNGGNPPNVDYTNYITLNLEQSSDSTSTYYSATATASGLAVCTLQSTTAITSNRGYWHISVNGNSVYFDELKRSGRYSAGVPVTKGDVITFGFETAATSANLNSTSIILYPYKEQNTYSTDEIIIGTWIDNKPIYRKVFTNINGPRTANTTEDLLDISSIDIKELLKMEYHFINDNRNGSLRKFLCKCR